MVFLMVFRQGTRYFLKCSIKRNSRAFVFFMELPPPLAQPPLSHHNHHYHPPLSPPPLSQPPQLTKASFSHLPLKFLREVSQESFVFTSSTFSSNKSFRETSEPCHVLRLLLILDEQRAPRKTVFQRAMGQRLTDRDCVIFLLSVRYRSGYRLGLVVSKNLQNNDSGKPFF